MNKVIDLDLTKVEPYLNEHEIEMQYPMVNAAHKMLNEKTGEGNEFLGWMDLPVNYDKLEFEKIKNSAIKIRNNSDVFIVIGIGGSYIGARAAIEALSHNFYNNIKKDSRNSPQIFYIGNNISSTYMADLLEVVKDEDIDISVNVISKSGTTTEPALAFRIFKSLLEDKYGKEGAKERIYVTTDKNKGALKKLSNKEGYETFVIPDDVGGRYSVLTAVGLLPIAVAGIDIDEIMKGAADSREYYKNCDLVENDCYRYAVVRNLLYNKGKNIEIIANFEPCMNYFGEWLKQLYGESEGKDNKGIFPATVNFSTDLHSMGQYIQDGLRNIFETQINIEKPRKDIIIEFDKENLDGLNFIADKSMDYVNKQAFKGTVIAHNNGGVPNIIINIPQLDAYNFGYMVYFFEKSCAISGYMLGVNPFNQPGVEDYKNNMFALLGKPGYEDIKLQIEKEL